MPSGAWYARAEADHRRACPPAFDAVRPWFARRRCREAARGIDAAGARPGTGGIECSGGGIDGSTYRAGSTRNRLRLDTARLTSRRFDAARRLVSLRSAAPTYRMP